MCVVAYNYPRSSLTVQMQHLNVMSSCSEVSVPTATITNVSAYSGSSFRDKRCANCENLDVAVQYSVLSSSRYCHRNSVVQSESNDGLIDGAIWEIWQIGASWCVAGDLRGEFYFRIYRMGIYITESQNMIEKSQSRKIRS